jgi:hypothetical protein
VEFLKTVEQLVSSLAHGTEIMTTNFTTTDDFAAITDGLESVTLLRRETPGGPGETIARALRRAMGVAEVIGDNRRNVESDGRYTAADVSWSLPAAELANPPRLGDVLQDGAGRRWTILDARLVALGDRWRCFTRELSIAFGLEDLIDVLEVDESGEWSVVREGVRGRIQPRKTKVVTTDSMQTSVRHCQIILEEPFDLDHTNRLRGPDGALYRIVTVAGFTRLGQLQTVDVEKIEDNTLLDAVSGVNLPEAPAGTYFTYEVDREAETVRVPAESLTIPTDPPAAAAIAEPGEVSNASPSDRPLVGYPIAEFPASATGDVALPITIHRLTWHRVAAPPWAAIRACQGALNESEFLGCPAGQLLFDGVRATREIVSHPDANTPQFAWRLEYHFREKPLLLNTTPSSVPTADFSQLVTIEES